MKELRVSLHSHDSFEARIGQSDFRGALEPRPLDEVLARLADVEPAEVHRLTIGGSPLFHPDWQRVLATLRERGFARMSLETETAPLAEPGRIEALKELGVDCFFLLAAAVRRKVHDAVLGDPGSFDDAMRGLTETLRSGVPSFVIVPVLRWNAEDVERLVTSLVGFPQKPAGVLLAPPEIDRMPPAALPGVLPYPKLAELAERVFRICQGHRIEYGFLNRRGVLPCAAGGHLERFATVFWEHIQFTRHRPAETLVRVPACQTCSLAQTCRGAERSYVGLFGTADTAPVPFEKSSGWKLRKHNSLEDRSFRNASPYENEVAENPMALVRVNGHCNMSCSFCFIDRSVPDFDSSDLLDEIRTLYAGGARHLVLSGGEPTLHPDLPSLVRDAKEMGYRVVEMQSNGVRAAEPEYAKALKEAGLDEVCLSLHSANPEKSDEITRLPNAFWKTVQGMHNFRELGLETKFAHVITELNYRELPDTVRFLRKEFPPEEHSFSICFGIAQPISDLVFSWVIPKFDDVKPFMRQALDYCMSEGIGFGGALGEGGYPPCMLDGELRYYEKTLGEIFRSEDHERRMYKAPRCRECSFDPYCLGVRRDYVEFYGDAELRPFKADVPAPPPKRARAVITPTRALVPLGTPAASGS
jgi:MoaA/NifB/PqqE/SkfB family radical SAM enzyme